MISNFNNLNYWVGKTIALSSEIETAISKIKEDNRTETSKNILRFIRSFVEKSINCLFLKVSNYTASIRSEQEVFDKAKKYLYTKNDLKYLCSFHSLINKGPTGHDVVTYSDHSVRFFLIYFDILIKLKIELKKHLDLDVLTNLEKYPLDMDETLFDYYSEIQKQVIEIRKENPIGYKEKYYVLSKRMIYLNNKELFEYTISVVDDNPNKSDTITAYSDIDVFDNYCVEMQTYTKTVSVNGISLDVEIILNYDVRIRDCELQKVSEILRLNFSGVNKTAEYMNLMSYIKTNRVTLAEIVKYNQKDYDEFEESVLNSGLNTKLKKLITYCRDVYKEKLFGINTLMYLLAKTENNTINKQLPYNEDDQLSLTELKLSKAVFPFELTPFSANLKATNTILSVLMDALDINEHKCELIKREIDQIAERDGIIYNKVSQFGDPSAVLDNVKKYNNKVGNYKNAKIGVTNFDGEDYIFSEGNESDTKEIFAFFKRYSETRFIDQYELYINNKMISLGMGFEDDNKRKAISSMFNEKSIYAVYGPAGTGKSFLIDKVVRLLENYSILCLTTTYAAKSNLEKRINSKKPVYRVIEKVNRSKNDKYQNFDIVIIDECSTVSNRDMATLIKHINPKAVLLIGDTFQIESIGLGNWFDLFRKIFDNKYYVDLDHCFRTNDEILSTFWKKTREKMPELETFMLVQQISHDLKEANEILNYNNVSNAITLCLNYNGLLGINNINKIIQKSNPNKSVYFRRHTYKIGDPIIFKDARYFKDIFYNNQKGTIVDIVEDRSSIVFTVVVPDFIEKTIAEKTRGVFVDYLPSGSTKVTFKVWKFKNQEDTDNNIGSSYTIPFSVGYAVSIHKAQGLEFEKVRVIITSYSEDNISHNVFYTAITRATKMVDIYWTAESENKIISSFYNPDEVNEMRLLNDRIFYPIGFFKKS